MSSKAHELLFELQVEAIAKAALGEIRKGRPDYAAQWLRHAADILAPQPDCRVCTPPDATQTPLATRIAAGLNTAWRTSKIGAAISGLVAGLALGVPAVGLAIVAEKAVTALYYAML